MVVCHTYRMSWLTQTHPMITNQHDNKICEYLYVNNMRATNGVQPACRPYLAAFWMSSLEAFCVPVKASSGGPKPNHLAPKLCPYSLSVARRTRSSPNQKSTTCMFVCIAHVCPCVPVCVTVCACVSSWLWLCLLFVLVRATRNQPPACSCVYLFVYVRVCLCVPVCVTVCVCVCQSLWLCFAICALVRAREILFSLSRTAHPFVWLRLEHPESCPAL